MKAKTHLIKSAFRTDRFSAAALCFIITSKGWLLLTISILFSFLSFSQSPPQQLSPANGSNGVSGAVSNSFIIKWDTVSNAAYYQYVISNNHLCFNGCAGDTREGTTTNTSAILYNFPPNTWYYWIVRAVLTTGDTTASSGIWSFKTENSGEESSYISINQDPGSDKITVGIEWVVDPSVRELNYDIINEKGQQILMEQNIKLTKDPAIRQEWFPISSVAFQSGTYYFIFRTDFKKEIIKKVIIVN